MLKSLSSREGMALRHQISRQLAVCSRQLNAKVFTAYCRLPTADSHFRSDDGGFKSELPVHHPMHAAHDPMMAFPEFLSEQIQPRAGGNLHAEFRLLDPPEADEAFPADERSRVEARELGGGLDHEHAGEQR